MHGQRNIKIAVAANNMNVFSGGMEMEQWLPFALLSNYKLFLTALDRSKYLKCVVCVSIRAFSYRACQRHLFCAVFYCHLCPV